MLIAEPAYALKWSPFATYRQVGTRTSIEWLRSGPLTGQIFSTLPGLSSPSATPVMFNFTDTSLYLSDLPALLTLTGSVTGVPATDDVQQAGISGAFNFLYDGPTTSFMGRTYTHDVTNLLTGAYTLGRIDGIRASAWFHGSTKIGTVVFTSDIFQGLSSSFARNFAFRLTSIAPQLGHASGNRALHTFKADSRGLFSALSVPEPATWAMLISGFSLIGLAARRRRACARA
jgi:hypothetical protein